MGPFRKFGAALVMAAVMAGGLGTATLEAKKPGSGGDPTSAICSYLASVISYPYVSATVLAYASSLWNYYGCTK